ncbi:hypothetical protein OG285_32655 [Streptomyces sp. NBC_01471]|uniref:hypothetical protein n=1 Tax=Streptomyces sp. NBC_01471 TaxID=2903879 RepID=UPI003249E09A
MDIPHQHVTGHLVAAGYRQGCPVGPNVPIPGPSWAMHHVRRERWPEGAVECKEIRYTLDDSWARRSAALRDQEAADQLAIDTKAAYGELTAVLQRVGYTVEYVEQPYHLGTMEWLFVHALAGDVAPPPTEAHTAG